MARKPKMSRGLSERRRLAETIQHFVEAHWPRVLERRAELLGRFLEEGETLPDGGFELVLWLRRLDRLIQDAGECEMLHRRGLIALGKRQEKRDQAVETLQRRMGAMRRFVDAALGTGTATKLLHFDGRTRRRYDTLERQAAGVLVRVEELGSVQPILEGIPADSETWAAMIRKPLAALQECNARTLRQEKTVDGLLNDKTRSFSAFDLTARGLIRKLVGELQAVGEEELAKLLRRLTRRRKRPGPKRKPKRSARKKAKVEGTDVAGGSGEATVE